MLTSRSLSVGWRDYVDALLWLLRSRIASLDHTVNGPIPPLPLFVDPQNSSGVAADTNTGQTDNNVPAGSGPLLTTTKANANILANAVGKREMTVPLALQYLSDDTSGTPLNLNPLALIANGQSVTVSQTPQQVNPPVNVTAVTAIDPTTNHHEQITTTILDLTPFVTPPEGGTSPTATFFQVVGGPHDGDLSWIESTTAGEGGSTAQANATRPVDATVSVSGTFSPGDSVRIMRGGFLQVETNDHTFLIGIEQLTFRFVSFQNTFSVSPNATPLFEQCSFDASSFTGGIFTSVAVWNGIAPLETPVLFDLGGFYIPAVGDGGIELILGGDVYVGGVTGIVAGAEGWVSLLVETGAFSAGACFRCHGTDPQSASVTFMSSQVVGAGSPVVTAALLWGSASATSAFLMWPGATVTVSSQVGLQPTIGSSAQAIGWLDSAPSGVKIIANEARTFDEVTNTYSALFSTITFANLFNPATLNDNAHRLNADSHVIAVPAAS